MSNRLSYSQISKYSQCPKSYQYYYKDKLREKTASSFLSFGSAMDNALNSILSSLKESGKVDCDYRSEFDRHWQNITINKKTYPLMDCTLVGYAKDDFVSELLREDDLKLLGNPTAIKEEVKELQDKRTNGTLDVLENRYLNTACWLSLRRKGHLMLDAYVRDIVPKIEQVVEIQKKVELVSNNGDTLIGYVDAIVKIKDHEKVVVLDNKTSSSPYSKEKLDFSAQLSIYTFALGYKSAGYAVMLKSISLNKTKVCKVCKHETDSSHKTCNSEATGKRCGGEWSESYKPEAKTQLFVDNIRQNVQNVVLENVAEISDAIKAEVFPRNFGACANMFGKPCPYISKCFRNDDGNLEKVE